MKIDENAVVPIGWVLTGFGLVISTTLVGAFWVSAVNFRLQRIEEKLGIPPYQSKLDSYLIPSFKEDESNANTQRLSRALQLLPVDRRPAQACDFRPRLSGELSSSK